MASTSLWRVPIHDAPKKPVLLLRATVPNPAEPLRVKLAACDGFIAYSIDFDSSSIAQYKRKNAPPDEEIEALLLYYFARKEPDDQGILQGMGWSATLETKKTKVTLAKSIGGILQPIIAFEMLFDKRGAQLFDWAADACLLLESETGELIHCRKQMAVKDETIRKLTQQLEDMATLKKEHEETLLAKFREVVNCKKSKIRELDRKLAATPPSPFLVPDEAEVEPEGVTRGKGRKRATSKKEVAPKKAAPPKKAPARGGRKRKPVTPPPAAESESEDDLRPYDEQVNAKTKDEAKGKESASRLLEPARDDESTEDEEDEQQMSDRQSEDEEEAGASAMGRQSQSWTKASWMASGSKGNGENDDGDATMEDAGLSKPVETQSSTLKDDQEDNETGDEEDDEL